MPPRRGDPQWKHTLYNKWQSFLDRYFVFVWCYFWIIATLSHDLFNAARAWTRHRIEQRSRARFGGIPIAESNSAHPSRHWLKRRKSLSQGSSRRNESCAGTASSPILGLPEEIRRQIFLHIICPAEELTVCSMRKEERLIAVPSWIWKGARLDIAGDGQILNKLQQFLNLSMDEGPHRTALVRGNMLTLAKVNRQL